MTLEVQIQSIIYSFVYGLFFSFLLNFNYRFLFLGKRVYRILINFLFIVDNVLLYFILLRYINYGEMHYYFLLLVILGYFVGNHTTKKIRFWDRKWLRKRK